VDVVIVEDHHGRDRGEQPADVGVRPRLPVQPGVLLEVGDLLTGRRFGSAARLDELERSRGDLVCVDLVSEEEEGVGPFHLTPLELLRVRPERVDSEGPQVFGPLAVDVLRLGIADAARAEDEAHAGFVVACVDDGLRAPVVGRPDDPPVEPDVV
jgi:hypothetical protein